MKIKTNYDGCPYITAGKEYPVRMLEIIDDDGDYICCTPSDCENLGGHDWQVAQEERFSQEVAQEMYELLASLREDYGGSSVVGKEIDELLAKPVANKTTF